ncbi:hypothetical protein ACTQ49_09005 [Luteococcus sp. Sow4_B9]|uniref:hypothetical protein n=1 Tax=Luteococcus sp. Sow4_B9 TaxID=3438792 RepID=UPI003F96FD4C
MQSDPRFEAVRRMTDPLAQARAAGELIGVYQQRSVELSRIRKAAMEAAVDQRGITFTELAKELGLTKGRVSQIRSAAPPRERALFGVGPITLAAPLRAGDRPEGYISRHDSIAVEKMAQLLTSLSFSVDRYLIPSDGQWIPGPDAVAICGPKSSPVTAEAIANDPWLDFSQDAQGNWLLRHCDGESFTSPFDLGDPSRDLAYVARLPFGEGSIFVIAGVHALGSLGAVEYLQRHAHELYDHVGEQHFSMIVRGAFDTQGNSTETEALWGPAIH